MTLLLVAVLGYVAVQLVVGMWVSRGIRSETDYLLAGRSLGLGMATLSLFATWFGAESCIGAAGAVYSEGLSGGRADPFGYAACLLLMGGVYAAALRRTGAVTLAEAMRQRFSGRVGSLVVLMTVPASLLWAAAQIRALAQVLSAFSSFGLEVTLTFAALVVLVYTVSGGLRADVMTDVVQGVALLLGLAVLGVTVTLALGGPAEALARLPRASLAIEPAAVPMPSRLEAWFVPILGSVTAQEMASRVLACRTPSVASRSGLAAGGLYLLAGLVPVTLGLLGPQLAPGLADPEQLLPTLARTHLPPWLTVVFVGALVSAILSTVDSNLLSAASLLAHDGVLRVRPVPDERRRLALTRGMTVLAGVAAYALAFSHESVHDLVESSSAFGGAGLFVAMTFGLLTRFGGAAAGLAAVATGIVTQVLGDHALGFAAPFTASLATASIAYVVVGAWTGLRERKLKSAGPAGR